MHFLADAVSRIGTDHAVAEGFRVALHSVTDVVERRARLQPFDSLEEAFLGDLDELFDLGRDAADTKGARAVAVVAVFIRA